MDELRRRLGYKQHCRDTRKIGGISLNVDQRDNDRTTTRLLIVVGQTVILSNNITFSQKQLC